MKNNIFFVFFFFINFLICEDHSFDKLNSDDNTTIKTQKEKKSLRTKSYLPLLQNLQNSVGVTNGTLVKKIQNDKSSNSSKDSSSYDDESYLDDLFNDLEYWDEY